VDAYLGFRKTLDEVLAQIAEDSQTIEDFARRIVDFFSTRDEDDSATWLAAVDDLRSRKSRPSTDLESLPRLAAETRPEVLVEGASSFLEHTEVLSLATSEPLPKAA
jgi:hypothetical protein